MSPTTAPTAVAALRGDRSAMWLGLAIVGVLALTYPLIAESAQYPLAVFLLAPLFTGVLSGPRETTLVGIVATAVAVVEGLLGPLDAAALAARLGILVAAAVLAVAAAAIRRRREAELSGALVRSVLSETFQGGLMPSPRPPRWLEAETRYRPGSRGLMLGGDFVDVVTLPDGAAAFVIGDVCGHGARAAAFGTSIRAAWKGLAFALPADPVRWLDEVERAYFRDGRFDGYVTAITGRIETDGRWRVVAAGHPWPIRSGVRTEVQPMLASLPLGTGLRGERRVTVGRLEPGESLLLYTDGLLENRRGPLGVVDDRRLSQVVGASEDPPDLDRLLETFGPDGFEDDVALLRLTSAVGRERRDVDTVTDTFT